MAINPETQYPGKIAPSTPDYPYGAARNITVPGDGTGTPWESALVNDLFGWQQAILSEGGVVPSGTPEKATASQYLEAMDNRRTVVANIIVNIPTDFPTLKDAIDKLNAKQNIKTDTLIELRFEAGHNPATGLTVSNGDFSKFLITSVDAVLTVDATWSATSSFVKATNASAPVLGCLVDMLTLGDHGYNLEFNSRGYVLENCGVDNAGGLGVLGTGAGLFLNGASQCSARNSIFRGAKRNVWISHSSQCYADFGDYSGCVGDAAVYIARSSIAGVSYSDMTNSAGAGLRVRRSYVTALAADASGAAADGILAQEGSTVITNDQTVDPFNCDNCGQNGVSADASFVDFRGGTAQGAINGIRATGGAKVVADGATLSSVGNPSARGINADSSIVIAQGAVMNDTTSTGVIGVTGSTIDLTGAFINNSAGRGVDIGDASTAVLKSANVLNSGSDGVRAVGVSRIAAQGATITGSGTGFDVVVTIGSQVSLDGATTSSGAPSAADTNVGALNTFDSDGMVWA